MNKFITLVAVLFSMSYNTIYDRFSTHTEFVSQEENIEKEEPYELKLEVKKLKNNTYNLIIKMELEKDAHYVSPNSKGDFSGQFAVFIDSNTYLTSNGKLSESPLAKEIYNPFGDGKVSFVKDNTTHTQELTVTNKSDFEVSGLIQFVIEPRCTMEKINFTITNRSGNLTIKKVISKK